MNKLDNLKGVIYSRLEAIAAAEKITRFELAAFSREALEYVPETSDIDVVNRLLGVLTPVNRKAAILFFSHFLPWEVEKDTDDNFIRFGKRLAKEKQVARRMEAIAEFLAEPENTIWTWADAHIDVEKKSVDLRGGVKEAIVKALHGTQETRTKLATPALTQAEVIALVLEAGVSIDEMMEVSVHIKDEMEKLAEGVMEAA